MKEKQHTDNIVRVDEHCHNHRRPLDDIGSSSLSSSPQHEIQQEHGRRKIFSKYWKNASFDSVPRVNTPPIDLFYTEKSLRLRDHNEDDDDPPIINHTSSSSLSSSSSNPSDSDHILVGMNTTVQTTYHPPISPIADPLSSGQSETRKTAITPPAKRDDQMTTNNTVENNTINEIGEISSNSPPRRSIFGGISSPRPPSPLTLNQQNNETTTQSLMALDRSFANIFSPKSHPHMTVISSSLHSLHHDDDSVNSEITSLRPCRARRTRSSSVGSCPYYHGESTNQQKKQQLSSCLRRKNKNSSSRDSLPSVQSISSISLSSSRSVTFDSQIEVVAFQPSCDVECSSDGSWRDHQLFR